MSKKCKRMASKAKVKPKAAAFRSKAARDGAAKHREHKKRLAARTTTQKLVWRHVTARVRHTPNYISTGWSHIEITVQEPKGAPIPITETGYKSHFIDEDILKKAGGPAAFFLAWIEQEAKTKAWAKAEAKWRQLELFDK